MERPEDQAEAVAGERPALAESLGAPAPPADTDVRAESPAQGVAPPAADAAETARSAGGPGMPQSAEGAAPAPDVAVTEPIIAEPVSAEPATMAEPIGSAEPEEVPAAPQEPPQEAAVEQVPADGAEQATKPAPAPKVKTKGKSKARKVVPEEPKAVLPEEPKSDKMDWYILKVQSNREESIAEGLLRRVAIAGFGRYFGDVIVPTEKVTEFKGGKKRVAKRKLYPGYLVVQMEINEDTWFLVRETPGIGDFTGAAGRPSPMLPHEVARILAKHEEKSEKAPKLKIGVNVGERVKINEGTFENFEGEVESIDETNGRVTVMINIFGRSTPVELEYWQIEAV